MQKREREVKISSSREKTVLTGIFIIFTGLTFIYVGTFEHNTLVSEMSLILFFIGIVVFFSGRFMKAEIKTKIA